MANPVNTIDFSIPLTTFLAQSVGGGTNADILQLLKLDKAGSEVAAPEIPEFAGQLWSNRIDDFFLVVYDLMEGAKNYPLDTAGAVVDEVTLATLSADGDAFFIDALVVGKTDSTGEIVTADIGGLFYRTGGIVLVADPIHSVTQVGLLGVDAALVIDGNDVDATVTGVAAKTIAWNVITRKVRRLRSP